MPVTNTSNSREGFNTSETAIYMNIRRKGKTEATRPY
jgi:hypothetical protein